MPRSRSWASPGRVALMEPNLNSEIINDKIDKETRPEEGRKEEARGEPILVKGEQTRHYLDREEEMQAQRKSRNKENPYKETTNIEVAT